jgi:FAS-associated factor 2
MENLMFKMLNVVEIYGPVMENQKAGKFKKESETEKLLKEQEKQFQEALKRDKERQEKLQIEAEKKKQEEIKKKLEEERKRKEIEDKKKMLPSEPSESEKDTTRVLLRLPDGGRAERRFRLSEKIGTIFDYLLVEKQIPSDGYDLVSNFPKITYCMEKHKDITLKDAKLYPQAALFVKEKN